MAAEQDQNLPNVLVLGPPALIKFYGKQLSENFNLLKPWEASVPLDQFLDAHARDIQAVLCSGVYSVTRAILDHIPSLRVIVTTSVGLDHIDLSECRRRGIGVANAAPLFADDVADLGVGLLLDVMRKITAADNFVRSGFWSLKGEYPLGSKVGGKRVGIVGLGNIGLKVARRLEAFGCLISYHSREKKPFVSSYTFYPNVCELAENCDILLICCALTDQTYHMINKDVLLALGKEGVIVNIARGAIIDEKALVQNLSKGEIAGAGLDVFENEPSVPAELCVLDNVVLSRHYAVFTEESFRELYELVLGNLESFFSNKPLLSPVLDE